MAQAHCCLVPAKELLDPEQVLLLISLEKAQSLEHFEEVFSHSKRSIEHHKK